MYSLVCQGVIHWGTGSTPDWIGTAPPPGKKAKGEQDIGELPSIDGSEVELWVVDRTVVS